MKDEILQDGAHLRNLLILMFNPNHSFIRHLMTIHYVPDTRRGSGDTAANKTSMISAFMEFRIQIKEDRHWTDY